MKQKLLWKNDKIAVFSSFSFWFSFFRLFWRKNKVLCSCVFYDFDRISINFGMTLEILWEYLQLMFWEIANRLEGNFGFRWKYFGTIINGGRWLCHKIFCFPIQAWIFIDTSVSSDFFLFFDKLDSSLHKISNVKNSLILQYQTALDWLNSHVILIRKQIVLSLNEFDKTSNKRHKSFSELPYVLENTRISVLLKPPNSKKDINTNLYVILP